jgi:tRNA A37 threonylcarbamoyltransferase TsaD
MTYNKVFYGGGSYWLVNANDGVMHFLSLVQQFLENTQTDSSFSTLENAYITTLLPSMPAQKQKKKKKDMIISFLKTTLKLLHPPYITHEKIEWS